MCNSAKSDVFSAPALLEHLHLFQAFVLAKAQELNVPESLHSKLGLVVEELVVNVSHYGYPGSEGNLEVKCFCNQDFEHSGFYVTLKDWGIPFNPLSNAKPNTELSIEERPVGGMGIFLAEEMTDSIAYKRKDGCNILTFGFNMQQSDH